MYSYLLEEIKANLDALPYLERYGGLIKKGYLNTSEGVKIYPVGCDVTNKDCVNNKSIYQQMVPNDKLKSIAYFEEVQPLVPVANFPNGSNNRNQQKLVGKLAFTFWGNKKNLGLQPCEDVEIYAPHLIAIIQTMRRVVLTAGPLAGAQYDIAFSGFQRKDKDLIFSPFNFKEKINAIYPNDFFQLHFDIVLYLCYSSINPPNNAPIDC